MANFRSVTYIPPLVKRAMNLAEQMEYKYSCSLEAGRLLQLLASQYQSGVLGEIGTGCGVSAAWIVSALSSGASFFTVEQDIAMAAAARALFEAWFNVRVIQGDWHEVLRNWRFQMLYASKSSPRQHEPEALVQALRQGGLILLDGLTPLDRIPLELRSEPDPVREFWLNDSRLLATEFQVSPGESVILATRID